jgi:hypothetical protein
MFGGRAQLRDIDRDIYEGEYHHGIGAVVQAIAIKASM